LITSTIVSVAILTSTSAPNVESLAQGDNKWTLLGIVITSLVAPAVILLINSRALRPPSKPDEEPNIVSTDRGTSFSIEGMSTNMVEVLLSMWKKLDEMEDNQESWSAERQEFIRINEELRRHNRALAEGFDEVIDWIDRGAKPPPPSVAQHVRDLVQRAIENGTFDGLNSDH